jgi:two-component system CheB/CheR fusion protein
MVVFATQNVIKDPPFSKIDLASCRNLLIYMDAVLQKKLLPLFHYGLNPDGILFLGTSETIGEFRDLYSSIDSKWKIFKRRETSAARAMDYPTTPFYRELIGQPANEEESVLNVADIHNVAERIILDHYAPSSVLVNQDYEIMHFMGETDRYLAAPTGKASFNILKMAREGLSYTLSTALHNAVRQKKTVTSRAVRIKYNNAVRIVDVTVRPIMEKNFPQTHMLVIFDEKMPSEPSTTKEKKPLEHDDGAPVIAGLEQELASTKEYLRTTIEELETSNEELKSTNEELQSVNEELQSTNEELETSKEELQSTNEELLTVNAELQNKVNELSRANNDINNLLSATDIAIIFLDNDLRIKRFTPAATKLFNLIQSDLGRPLGDINTKLLHVNLDKEAEGVLETLILKEAEIQAKDGSRLGMRMAPYRTTENVIDGVVATFAASTEEERGRHRRLAALVQDSNDAVTVQDFEGNIRAWNKGAEKLYGYSEAEATKMNIRDIIPKEKSEEALDFAKQVKEGKQVKSFKTQRKTKDGRILNIWVSATRLVDAQGEPVEIATTERDLAWLPDA